MTTESSMATAYRDRVADTLRRARMARGLGPAEMAALVAEELGRPIEARDWLDWETGDLPLADVLFCVASLALTPVSALAGEPEWLRLVERVESLERQHPVVRMTATSEE